MATRTNLAVGMIGSSARAVIWVALGAFALGAVAATRNALAQEPGAQPPTDESKMLTKDELAKLVGKIALYPDDLVAIVLPASTYPLQVVEAARFLEEQKKDSSLKPNEKWDDSIVALLNYPQVVKLMNDDLDWTWKLGDAVINQRAEVLDAIQGFRDRAYAAGNLKSDDHQVVQNDDGAIAIKPADPQVVYVPYYEPSQVVVYQPTPVYSYYPYGYPLYYYPYPYGYPFGVGFFWGVTSAFVIGWHSHYVHYYPCAYHGHPYYGHAYYGPNYVRNNVNVNVSVSHGNYVWQPHYVHGAQPFTRSDGRQLAAARHDGAGAPSGYRAADRVIANGDPGRLPSVASRDGVRRIQPMPAYDRVTTQSVRDELRVRESSHASFAEQGNARANGSTLTRGHGSGDIERHTVVPQPQQRFAYPQMNGDHSAALRASPPLRVAPAPVSPPAYAAPRMSMPSPSGGEAYASHAPRSAPQHNEGGAHSGGSGGHGAQGHAFSGRGGSR